ncbi:unnamed protein product [Amoebophrya sp. A120]|nr:unnamed protein product [Amoebophrya sp. A120]|eukprot:GSA120T00009135001.1
MVLATRTGSTFSGPRRRKIYFKPSASSICCPSSLWLQSETDLPRGTTTTTRTARRPRRSRAGSGSCTSEDIIFKGSYFKDIAGSSSSFYSMMPRYASTSTSTCRFIPSSSFSSTASTSSSVVCLSPEQILDSLRYKAGTSPTPSSSSNIKATTPRPFPFPVDKTRMVVSRTDELITLTKFGAAIDFRRQKLEIPKKILDDLGLQLLAEKADKDVEVEEQREETSRTSAEAVVQEDASLNISASFSCWSLEKILQCLILFSRTGCLCVPLFRKGMYFFHLILQRSRTTLAAAPLVREENSFSLQLRIDLLTALARQRARILVPHLGRTWFAGSASSSSSDACTTSGMKSIDTTTIFTAEQAMQVLHSCAYLRLPLPECVESRIVEEAEVICTRRGGADFLKPHSVVDAPGGQDQEIAASGGGPAPQELLQQDLEFLLHAMYHTTTLYHAQGEMVDIQMWEKVPTAGTPEAVDAGRASQKFSNQATAVRTSHERTTTRTSNENLPAAPRLSIEYVFGRILPKFAELYITMDNKNIDISSNGNNETNSTNSAEKTRRGEPPPPASTSPPSKSFLQKASVLRSVCRYLHKGAVELLNTAEEQKVIAKCLRKIHEDYQDCRISMEEEIFYRDRREDKQVRHAAAAQDFLSDNATTRTTAAGPGAPEAPSSFDQEHHDCQEVPPAEKKPIPRFLETVSWSLTKLRIAHSTEVERGPYKLDAVERDRKCVYRLLKQDRWLAESIRFTIGPLVLQELLLKHQDFSVINIPYWHWNKLKLRKTRIEYLRMSRYLALMDPRLRRIATVDDENNMNTSGTAIQQGPQFSLPATGNNFLYSGERFGGKRDVPNNAFSWFKAKEARPLEQTVARLSEQTSN